MSVHHPFNDEFATAHGEPCMCAVCQLRRLPPDGLIQFDVKVKPLDESKQRKATPITTGVLDYFPLAIAAVARLSKYGNDKHNPGEPLHWARGKANDHADCIARHLIDRGKIDPESGELHDVALAWRAIANLQLAEEKRLGISPPEDA